MQWSLIMRLSSRVILGVISNFMTNEIFIVLHMFNSFNGREVNGIDVHGIGISYCPEKEGSDAASSSKSSNLFLLSMEFACLFESFI